MTAVFEPAADHPVHALLKENGLDDEGTLILRRVQSADGRTRAYVNDQPASVQLLKTLGATLVEIHGQHDDRALIDPATHRRLLDAYGGLEPQVAEVGRLWRERRAAEERLSQARAALAKAEEERDYISHRSKSWMPCNRRLARRSGSPNAGT